MAARAEGTQECIIRPATDIEEARKLWWPLMLVLGWNRAEKDIKTHYLTATNHLGPSGWLHVADAKKPDEAEGLVVPFVFDNGTGWLGFFCMNEPKRGLGWGGKIFKACMDKFKEADANIVGLDGVEEQVKTYERRGFVDTTLIRLMARKSLKHLPLPGGIEHISSASKRIVPLYAIPSKNLVDSDLENTGFQRSKLWTKEVLLDRDDTFGLALIKEGSKEELEGWILVRECQDGRRIGPLYADSKQAAELLLHEAMRRVQSEEGSLISEVWMSNPRAVALFEACGWEWCQIDYHRMWLDGIVPEAQQAGGRANESMYAIFDAAQS